MKNSLLVKNTAWLMALQGINIILPFITVPYVTRVFGADLYGVFSLALNWVTYFQVVVEYGFNLSATRKMALSNTRAEQSSLLTAVVWARILLLMLCFAVVAVMACLTPIDYRQLICMFVLFSMLFGVAIQLNWLFQGLQDMSVITIATAISRFCSVALIFFLINNPSQLELYTFLYSFTFVLSGLITHIVAFKKYGLRVGFPNGRQIGIAIKDGWAIFVSSAAGKAIGSLGITVLGVFAPASVVGSYSAILKLPQLISMMFAPISQAIYPYVSQQFARSKSDAIKFVLKISVPVIAMFSIVLALIVVSRIPLVSLLFGDSYLICVDALVPLAIWVLLGIINNFLGIQLLIPMGKQKTYSVLMVADIACSLILNIVLGSVFGFMGIAVASVLSEGFLTLLLLVFVCHDLFSNNRLSGGVL